MRASASASDLVTRIKRTSSHLSLAPQAASRAIRRLPLRLRILLALFVLGVASLCATWLHDAGLRDRTYRAVTGYKRPPDARLGLPETRTKLCAPKCGGGGSSHQPACIPKVVHITYNSGGVLRHHRILESALAPGYTFRYYSDEQAARYVVANCSEYLETYECFLPTAYKADVFRYCVLLNEGGIYMDNDFALLVHPEPLMYNVSCGGVYLLTEYCENYGEAVRLWTGIMISAVNMPLWRCMLESVKNNVKHRFYGKNALDITGPELLARCAREFPEYIHPVGWNEKDTTMWLYPERHKGVPLQIGHEINTKYKDESRWKPPLHYHAQWLNKVVYSDHCNL
eukprot:m.14247 g.14247  ORF g.14247 m.14247 type:complete len:342 (+) comp8311_c0_seq2:274-1299(+)